MTYEEHFDQVVPQFLHSRQTMTTPSGLQISANGTCWIRQREAATGESGAELVINEHSDVQISFSHEIASLRLEYYVQSQRPVAQQPLPEGQETAVSVAAERRSVYWLTLSGSGFTDFKPGPLASEPSHQVLAGPFRRLTISTSEAGSVHVRKLQWTRTNRH
ncbi:hypothetical protein [Pseudomonas sp.]|uniref:hypothetical protein n=1 Tax=Pseudomonas sp. TaxID=306 RepID=UPI0028A85100|nr:hypothetical protein [Pseudomonas sp.]